VIAPRRLLITRFPNVPPFASHLQAVVSAKFCNGSALLGKPVTSYEFYDRFDDPEVLDLGERSSSGRRGPGAGANRMPLTGRQGAPVEGMEMETLIPPARR